MDHWQEIVRTGLVGTEKQKLSFAAPESGRDLGTALAELAADGSGEPERLLLRASGLLAVYRRPGRIPCQTLSSPSAPAAPETRPRAAQSAVQDLLQMLADTRFRTLLPEWLQFVAEQGQVVPEDVLPDLLDFGRGHPDVQQDILPVLGERGRWLAARNSDWKYALQISLFEIQNEAADLDAAQAEAAWQTGTRQERVALLQRMRRSDPERARKLIEATWAEDAPEERAAFIAPLESGLSMADEPLLESALDDRRKEVRTAAQELLYRLPESRLCRRMWERVERCVRLVKRFGIRDTLEITLPEACDKAMVRDGITQKPAWSGQGDKSWWLQQIIERVPPVFWSREWNRPAETIVAANQDKEWASIILLAWMTALERNPDSAWAVSLFNRRVLESEAHSPMDARWAALIPRDVFEMGILRLMEAVGRNARNRVTSTQVAFELADTYPKPWPLPFARKMLDYLRAMKGQDYQIAGRYAALVQALPDELKRECLEDRRKRAGSDPYMQNHIANYLAAEEFRTEMRRKIING